MEALKQFFFSRLTQLAVRYIAAGLTFVAGATNANLPTTEITSSAETLGTLAAAGVLFLLDLLIHVVRNKVSPPSSLIAFLLVPALLMMSGCVQTSKHAQRNNEEQARAAAGYQKNIEKLVYELIDDICNAAYAKADALAADAVAAETGPDGKANAKNLDLIQRKKLEHYQAIEANRMALRAKLIEAAQDMDHLRKYNAALVEYWDKSASTAGLLNKSSETVIGLLDKFVRGPKAQIVSSP